MSKHITKLQIRDTLRIKAVDIEPSGSRVVLTGKNGAGKSAIFRAIVLALGDAKSIEKYHKITKPIRDGADRAEVLLETEDLRVRWICTASGERVTVSSKEQEGMVYTKPRTMLSKLFNAVTFNPLRFANADQAEQTAILQKMMGIDFSELEAEHSRIYAERTEINRQGRDLKGVVSKMPFHENAPAEEVSVSGLVTELERREAIAKAQTEKLEALVQADQALSDTRSRAADISAKIVRLKQELAGLESSLAAHNREADEHGHFRDELKKQVEAQIAPNVLEVKQQISDSEAVNRKVRANQRRAAEAAKVEQLRQKSQALTQELDRIKAAREKQIADAKFPVPGLGFSEDGVTYNGIPFSQSSHAERIKVSVAIGIADNPELHVFLIEDASTIDQDNLSLLYLLAEEYDYHVWIEDARSQDPEAIIIEDGEILSDGEPGKVG